LAPATAFDVDVELAVVKSLVDLRDRHELGDPGVDEQDVYAPVFCLDLINQGPGRGDIGRVGKQHFDSRQYRLGGFHRALAGAGNDYRRAFGLKQFGGLRADTAGASADKTDLAVEFGHEVFLTGAFSCPGEMGFLVSGTMAACDRWFARRCQTPRQTPP
jgi:hypothetical protein